MTAEAVFFCVRIAVHGKANVLSAFIDSPLFLNVS